MLFLKKFPFFPTEIFKKKILIKKLMKIKRGKGNETEFREKMPQTEEDEDFIDELDLLDED